MAKFFDPTYDPSLDAASSGVEVSDLNPERIYDTDLRRVSEEDRSSAESVNDKQDKVAKFMRAAKSAGAYRQRAGIAEPTIGGRTPRNPAIIDVQTYGVPFGGTELPSMGDTAGRAGSTNYADRPQPNFGRGFLY